MKMTRLAVMLRWKEEETQLHYEWDKAATLRWREGETQLHYEWDEASYDA